MAYGIWCEVWGGITGSREAWYKDKGQVQVFETREEAQQVADKLLAATMGNTHRVASFRYTVEDYSN